MSVIRSGWSAIGRVVMFALLLYFALFLLGILLLIALAIIGMFTGGPLVLADIPLAVIIANALLVLAILLFAGILAALWLWWIDLTINFFTNWVKSGFGSAWTRWKEEAAENLAHLKAGVRKGVVDFVRKVPAGDAIYGGLQTVAQGVKKGIDEGKKILKGFAKWLGFTD